MTNDHKTPKRKRLKKAEFLKKKSIAAYGIISVVAIAGIIGGIFIFREVEPEYPDLIVGLNCGFWVSIDPLNTFVPTDRDVISQVVEGLFDHSLADSNSLVIPNLATSYSWSPDYLNLTCELRKDVKFHDGTPFNAAAVKWNFDRIYNLIDLGSVSPFSGIADFWKFPDDTRIINETEIINNYSVRFILNKHFIPLPALLASITSYILSPTSTPYNDFLLLDGDLVGTGPFIYDEYIENERIVLSSNPSYWGGQPKINKLKYLIISDKIIRYSALTSGDYSILSGYHHIYNPTQDSIYYDDGIDVDSFANFFHPSIIVQEGPPMFHFTYLLMNNELIPVEMRKAISYSLDYTLIIDEIINGHGERLKSPIPEGMLYSNLTDINYPYYNVSKARQTLKDTGWPGTSSLVADNNITAGNEWEKLVTDDTPLETYNFTYTLNDYLAVIFAPLLENQLKQIGIKLEHAIVTDMVSWFIYTEQYGYHLNMLEFSILGYNGPHYNDPSSIINVVYSNSARDSNYCQVNDPSVQQWMTQALEEPDTSTRAQIYYDIQKRLSEEVFPLCYLYRKNYLSIYRSNVKGWQVHQFWSKFKNVYF